MRWTPSSPTVCDRSASRRAGRQALACDVEDGKVWPLAAGACERKFGVWSDIKFRFWRSAATVPTTSNLDGSYDFNMSASD